MAIKKDTLHPEGEPEIDIYPKTSIDQVENLQANLDALNGDIANISTNVETIANRVEIAENSITVLTTAYESYTDYTEVTNGFLLTYLSGRQIELPIKAGTNVTFSKYPGTNQIVINSTGGSVPDNIAYVSDIPTRPQYLQGSGMETPTDFSFEIGIYHTLTITLIDSYKSTSIIIPNDYDGSQIDLDIDGDYFVVTLEDEKLSVKNNTSNRSWVGKLE